MIFFSVLLPEFLPHPTFSLSPFAVAVTIRTNQIEPKTWAAFFGSDFFSGKSGMEARKKRTRNFVQNFSGKRNRNTPRFNGDPLRRGFCPQNPPKTHPFKHIPRIKKIFEIQSEGNRFFCRFY